MTNRPKLLWGDRQVEPGPRRKVAVSPARAVACLLVFSLRGTAVEAQRPVEGNTIRSATLPAASVRVAETMTYVGSTAFDLYGVADAEIHIFVEAEEGRVKRLLWVQFEGYREDNRHTYDYSEDPAIEVDGRTFRANARFYPASGFGGRPGSDGDHAARLLKENGYSLGSDLARVRLVWLLNDPPRDELMFIYLEDLAEHGTTVSRLASDESGWRELARGLEARGAAAFEISANIPAGPKTLQAGGTPGPKDQGVSADGNTSNTPENDGVVAARLPSAFRTQTLTR